MKTITIISSPKTSEEYNIEKITAIECLNDHIYIVPGNDIEIGLTQAQSKARIKELEEQLFELSEQLDKIHDIIDPNRYDYEPEED